MAPSFLLISAPFPEVVGWFLGVMAPFPRVAPLSLGRVAPLLGVTAFSPGGMACPLGVAAFSLGGMAPTSGGMPFPPEIFALPLLIAARFRPISARASGTGGGARERDTRTNSPASWFFRSLALTLSGAWPSWAAQNPGLRSVSALFSNASRRQTEDMNPEPPPIADPHPRASVTVPRTRRTALLIVLYWFFGMLAGGAAVILADVVGESLIQWGLQGGHMPRLIPTLLSFATILVLSSLAFVLLRRALRLWNNGR